MDPIQKCDKTTTTKTILIIIQVKGRMNGEPEPGVSGYSYGLCSLHARLACSSAFRKQQIRECNPDSYLRCFEYCHWHWCTFYPICPIENPGQNRWRG